MESNQLTVNYQLPVSHDPYIVSRLFCMEKWLNKSIILNAALSYAYTV